ncbi:MAG: hypothetical protein LBT46_06365 [Planctomycetaceae bacterium]|jgi:hypothetical protein|nr:hypothetical protein [Planctomycetaceae bacterium]
MSFQIAALFRIAVITGFLLLVNVKAAEPQSPALNAVLRSQTSVFAPGEPVLIDLTLNNSNNNNERNNERKYHLHVALLAEGKPLAELETAIIANAPQALPVSFAAPENDGVYEITAMAKLPMQVFDIRRNLTGQGQALTVRQHFAVINPNLPVRGDGDLTLSPLKRDLLEDRGEDSGRRFFLPMPQGHLKPLNPSAMLPSAVFRLPAVGLGKKETPPPSDTLSGTVSDAPVLNVNAAALRLPIPVEETGKPYLIEIGYPLNTRQQLGAAVEEDAAITSAARIDIADEIVRDKRLEMSGTHKILFWAKSKKPELILVNLLQPEKKPAVNSIRVAGLLPPGTRIPKRFEGVASRKLTAVISGNAFKGCETVPAAYNAVSQLTDSLCYNGYDGAMLTVLSGNVHLSDTVLELLFQQFDRDRLTFIPVIEADTLEKNAVQNGGWQGFVRELTQRYASRPSFGGVSILHNGRWSAAEVPHTALFYHPADGGYVSVPADYQNRRRFVKQLAQADTLTFFDGGERLPAGEQDALTDLLAAYRKLPPLLFRTFDGKNSGGKTFANKNIAAADQSPDKFPEQSLQPLTVRSLNADGGLYVYLVNDAPYQIDADVTFAAGVQTQITELSGRRMIRSLNNKVWRATLLPYDLLAVKLDSPDTVIQNVSVIRPPEICGEKGSIKEKTDELGQRIYAARNGVVWDQLPNSGFEEGDAYVPLTGWQPFGTAAFSAVQDTQTAYSGQSSAKLTNTGTESGTLLTLPFSPPQTGRLWIAAFVGVPEAAEQIPLNFVLTAEHGGRTLYRHAAVGENLKPYIAKAVPKNGVRWQQVIVPFDQLPPDNSDNIRIGFQVTNQATLWIDEVKVYPVSFSSNEMIELQKVLVTADARFKQERFSELLTLLESPQCQFLFSNVPLPMLVPKPALSEISAPVAERAKTDDADSSPAEKPTLYQRFKGLFVR